MPSSEVSVTSGTWSLVITEKRGMAGHDQDETARSERTWERERKEQHSPSSVLGVQRSPVPEQGEQERKARALDDHLDLG